MDTRIDFLYMSEQDMIDAGVTDMHNCIEVMTEMFRLLGKGDYVMGGKNRNSHGIMITFPKTSEFPNMPTDGPDRRYMSMPAYLGGDFDVCGDKWYGSNKENTKTGLPRSILMFTLNDKNSGAPLAYQSANLLSAVRTGAIPGVCAKFLSKQDSKVLGIVGPGVVSRTSSMAILDACPSIDTVKIYGRREITATTLADFLKDRFPQVKNFIICDSMENAIRESDVICIATSGSGSDPYIKEEWIKPGALLTLPASIKLDDDFIVNRARNVVDNWKMYEAWKDEYDYPYYQAVDMLGVYYLDLIHDGKMKGDQIDNLGDIIAGRIEGRKSDDEIILFTTGGMPVEDVAWGYTMYKNALKKGIGTKLNLWEKPSMF